MEDGEIEEVSERKKARTEKKLLKTRAEVVLRSHPQIIPPIPSTSAELTEGGDMFECLQRINSQAKQLRRDSEKNFPKVCLTMDKLRGRQLTAGDVQTLILYSILHSESGSGKPKWCHLKPWRSVSQVIVIVVEMKDFPQNVQLQGHIQDHFPFARRFFRDRVLMRCRSLAEFYSGILRVPVSPLQILKEKMRRNAIETEEKTLKKARPTDFILSVAEMLEFSYPLPLDIQSPDVQEESFVFSCPFGYASVTEKSPVFAIDCEMCLTGREGLHELTRVSMVDENLVVLLDTLVKPLRPITNYLTKYSGITGEMLQGVTANLDQVQQTLQRLLPPDAILLGHSLNFDLKALRMYHPYVVDLSVMYNLSGTRQLKSSLQTLATTFLGESIQDSSKGHCSVEDAWATMCLFNEKCSRELDFGNVELGWSYTHYAAEKGMDRLGSKRKHEDDECNGQVEPKRRWKQREGEGVPFSPTLPPPMKKRKASSPSPPPSASTPSTCTNCALILTHEACRNPKCTCRGLKRGFCQQCVGNLPTLVQNASEADNNCKTDTEMSFQSDLEIKNDSEITSNTEKLVGTCSRNPIDKTDNGTTKTGDSKVEIEDPSRNNNEKSNLKNNMDWSEAVGLGELFVNGNREYDLLGEYLKMHKKKVVAAGNDKFISTLNGLGNLTASGHLTKITTGDSVGDTVTNFREGLLEHDMGILGLSVDGKKGGGWEELDEGISKVVFSAPKKALVTLALLPLQNDQDSLFIHKEAIICLRIKN